MIIGAKSIFAIESEINCFYPQPSLRGLGFFVIHLQGETYGIKSPDATALACSYDAVISRINRKGCHEFKEASNYDADTIARAVREAIYTETENNHYLGVSKLEFLGILSKNDIVWAPDGDAAFDDGSYVLHFDCKDRVRLIAFKSGENELYEKDSLREMWLSSRAFYDVLNDWSVQFDAIWKNEMRMKS